MGRTRSIGILSTVALAALLAGAPRLARAGTCGDNIEDPGEECDTGKYNGVSCCDANCKWRPDASLCFPANATPCRQGICDREHTCAMPEGKYVDPCTRTTTCHGCVVTGTGLDGFACTGPASADGTACADDTGPNHRCTVDVCTGGECTHTPKECPPAGAECMTSACNPEKGECETKRSTTPDCGAKPARKKRDASARR